MLLAVATVALIDQMQGVKLERLRTADELLELDETDGIYKPKQANETH